MGDNANTNITSDQWQSFMAGMQQQNAALAAQLQASQQQNINTQQSLRKAAIDSLEPDKKAEALEAELNAIKNAANAANQQMMSNDVWQRRDAESAARLLQMAGMNGQEAGLYRQSWDVNWMPRFTASVENLLQQRRSQTFNNPSNNPANRANVGSGTGQGLPEIDEDHTSGFDMIQYALSKGR
jgi:hypothetical protein